MSDATLKAAQSKVTEQVMGLPGVTGTALGLHAGKPCIKVYVSGDTRDLGRRIPRKKDGIPVILEKTGSFKAY